MYTENLKNQKTIMVAIIISSISKVISKTWARKALQDKGFIFKKIIAPSLTWSNYGMLL